tara:strand:- start:3537 stop:4247 length:711 start_codon:yes stop_codon:yes gene_type:complete
MKILILTTNTPHHIYFVREISMRYKLSGIVVEENLLIPPFDIDHPFEKLRDSYEKKALLNDTLESFSDYSETKSFKSINDAECEKYVNTINPEIIITFGTGFIKSSLINKYKNSLLNLHGGDPQYYRGLDSHLWAIYHKDFSQLKVTLHQLNAKLDDGEIIEQESINIYRNYELYKLRSDNTKVCIDLTLSALKKYNKKNKFKSYPQKKIGRYYSFMPSVIKEICVNNFKKYVQSL